jgi:hypothetical protein
MPLGVLSMTTAISYSGSSRAASRPFLTKEVISTQLKKPWSHGRAYFPILTVIVLVLGSVIFLHLHGLSQKLFHPKVQSF